MKKKILFIGFGGNTGKYYLHLLIQDGFFVYLHDKNPQVTHSDKNTKVLSEKEASSLIESKKVTAVTLSPGVSLKQNLFFLCNDNQIPIFSELEYCIPYLKENTIIGITGTDGKSTTTAIIEAMLKKYHNSIACGNYGYPYSRLIIEKHYKNKILITELSSYQLELCKGFAIDIGIYLNIAPDHQDRYSSLNEYYLTKWKIAQTIKENGLFIVANSIFQNSLYHKNKKKIQDILYSNKIKNITMSKINTVKMSSKNFFWKTKKLSHSCIFSLYFRKKLSIPYKMIQSNQIQLIGKHNFSNILFATETILFLYHKYSKKFSNYNVSQKVKNTINQLQFFEPVKHRFQVFLQKNSNIYIDDSKATTTHAVMTALENTFGNTIIFLGGKGKNENYTLLAKYIKKKSIYPVLFGEEKDNLAKVLNMQSIPIIGKYRLLKDAFLSAKKFCIQNQLTNTTFILSPSCTSWDSYTSYKARGEHFQKIVKEYLKDNS